MAEELRRKEDRSREKGEGDPILEPEGEELFEEVLGEQKVQEL